MEFRMRGELIVTDYEIEAARSRSRQWTFTGDPRPGWNVYRDESCRAIVIRLPANVRKIDHPEGRFRQGNTRFDLCLVNLREEPPHHIGELPPIIELFFEGALLAKDRITIGCAGHG